LNARALFSAADGRLHAPWRILLFLLLSTICGVVVVVPLQPLSAIVNRLTGLDQTGESIALTMGLVIAQAVMLRWDRRPWSYVWLDASAARPRVLLFGFVTGAAPIAIASLVLMMVGWLTIVPAADGPWIRAALSISVLLLPAALIEELLSRGYIFATLGEWLGWPWAVGLTSVAFGLVHIGNPGTSPLPIVTVIVAGVYLAAVVLLTRSLYAAWVSHFAWNWVMAVPLHVEVSGVDVPRPDYRTIEVGPDWITGGPWGPEGGMAAVITMVAGLWYMRLKAQDSKLKAQGSNASNLEPQP
jgi:hypothetical protein